MPSVLSADNLLTETVKLPQQIRVHVSHRSFEALENPAYIKQERLKAGIVFSAFAFRHKKLDNSAIPPKLKAERENQNIVWFFVLRGASPFS
ncbi:hypothetical protein [Bacteroides reticulotermitis]|uniref:hypothetical protein n=1 Tax=Bacteroides reticulotermitis TaxID=1133319 RepID=UPI003A8BC72C